VSVTVTLVTGADGSTTKGGNSAGVSSQADRSKFLQRRREADCILIGGATARNEPYQRTPVPVVVLSRGLINPLANNRLAYCWNLSPAAAIAKARELFGPEIHVEAGVQIISELLAQGLVDRLELSITEITDGEDKIDISELLSHFSKCEEVQIGNTKFISAVR
jgi:riboflavin biosynthesis pyrimidine reductase